MKLRSVLMVGALLLGGCAVNPYGGSPAPVGETAPPVKQPDKVVTEPEVSTAQPTPVAPLGLAQAMANAVVQAPEVRALTRGDKPVLLLAPPQNNTQSQVDTDTMAAAMRPRIQAGGFRLVDADRVAAITGQLEYQQGGVNPASLVRLGRQTGAGYMLYGDLGEAAGRYQLAMSLMDLKSGELVWSGSRSAQR